MYVYIYILYIYLYIHIHLRVCAAISAHHFGGLPSSVAVTPPSLWPEILCRRAHGWASHSPNQPLTCHSPRVYLFSWLYQLYHVGSLWHSHMTFRECVHPKKFITLHQGLRKTSHCIKSTSSSPNVVNQCQSPDVVNPEHPFTLNHLGDHRSLVQELEPLNLGPGWSSTAMARTNPTLRLGSVYWGFPSMGEP